MSDLERWQALKDGDKRALEHIYRDHVAVLFKYGRKFIPDAQLVEDCIQDLRKANAKCSTVDPTPCFDVVFPAKVKLPSGVVVEIRSADAFRELIERWVKNNPLSTDRPELVFPYRVKTKDGKTVVIKDKEDLRKLLANCK